MSFSVRGRSSKGCGGQRLPVTDPSETTPQSRARIWDEAVSTLDAGGWGDRARRNRDQGEGCSVLAAESRWQEEESHDRASP